MPTRFYLQDALTENTPTTFKGTWDITSGAVTKRIETSKNGSAAVASAVASRSTPLPWDVCLYRGVSNTLAAQTISGTITGVLNLIENSSTADAVYHLHIWVTQGNTNTARGTILTNSIGATEISSTGGAGTGHEIPSTALSSLAITAGDRIVVEVGVTFGLTSGVSTTATLRYGGTDASPDAAIGIALSDQAPWIEFSGDLVGSATVAMRTSQVVTEAAILPSAAAALQVSQTVAEVAILPSATPAMQVSQTVVEAVILPSATPAMQVSQSVVEVAVSATAVTRLYLQSETVPIVPAAIRGAWDETVAVRMRALDTSKAGVVYGITFDKTVATNDWDQLMYTGVSRPLAAQTISGHFNVMIRVSENIAQVNAHYHVHVYVMKPDGTVRGTLVSDYTDPLNYNEWSTTAFTVTKLMTVQSMSSVVASSGDRIVAEIGVVQRSTNSSSMQVNMAYGDTAADAVLGATSGTGYIEFITPAAISFTTETETRSTFYLNNATAPYDPATALGAWDDTAGKVVQKLGRTKSGASTSNSVNKAVATNNWDALVYQGVSEPLAAQTIDGDVILTFATQCNGGAFGNFSSHIHIWVTQGDSATPRGTLLSDYVIALDDDTWNTASNNSIHLTFTPYTLSSLAVSAGDRLVVEIGYIARTTSTSIFGQIWYGATAGDLTQGSSAADKTTKSAMVTFSDDVLLLSEVPALGRSFAVFVG